MMRRQGQNVLIVVMENLVEKFFDIFFLRVVLVLNVLFFIE